MDIFGAIYNRFRRMKHFSKLSKQYANDNVKFESGLTSQQKYNSIAQSVLSKMSYSGQHVKGCPMHPKPSKKCRKCNQLLTQLPPPKEQQYELEESFPEMIVINTNNVKSHFNEKLQNNIENCYLFKSKIKLINSVRDLANDLTSDEISIDTYIAGSTESPTPFFCYFYRLAELRPTKEQLIIMLRANNVNVRCLALLYIRAYADPSIVYACMNGSFKDNKLLTIETIGEYAMRLVDEEKLDHGGFRLPRLPLKIQRAITKKINAIKDDRAKEIERQLERQRSREKQRRARQIQVEQERHRKFLKKRSSSGSSSSSSSSSSGSKSKQQKPESPKLTLREKIRLVEQKKAAQAKRQQIIASYKAAEVNNLESQEQALSENDQVQKYQMG